MSDITFEQVYELVEQLTLTDRMRLVQRLQAEMSPLDYGITTEQLAEEMQALHKSGAFENTESLYGKYVNPHVNITEEELDAYLHEIGTEWEAEMDEIIGGDYDEA